jgi:SPP1 family predicted phage head-tail adaptor
MKCCDITAGMLRHKINIESFTAVSDGAGGSTVTWAATPANTNIWCKVRPASGGERFYAMRTEADTTHVIITRWKTGITPAMRVNFGGRLMQIKSVINIEERDKWMEIRAVENEAT